MDYHGEFLAADAVYSVDRAQAFAQQRNRLTSTSSPVTCVAVGIVDALEVIDIEQNQRGQDLATLEVIDTVRDFLVKQSAIAGTGQRIPGCKGFEFAVLQLHSRAKMNENAVLRTSVTKTLAKVTGSISRNSSVLRSRHR